jgi:hypothetical protein
MRGVGGDLEASKLSGLVLIWSTGYALNITGYVRTFTSQKIPHFNGFVNAFPFSQTLRSKNLNRKSLDLPVWLKVGKILTFAF